MIEKEVFAVGRDEILDYDRLKTFMLVSNMTRESRIKFLDAITGLGDSADETLVAMVKATLTKGVDYDE